MKLNKVLRCSKYTHQQLMSIKIQQRFSSIEELLQSMIEKWHN